MRGRTAAFMAASVLFPQLVHVASATAAGGPPPPNAFNGATVNWSQVGPASTLQLRSPSAAATCSRATAALSRRRPQRRRLRAQGRRRDRGHRFAAVRLWPCLAKRLAVCGRRQLAKAGARSGSCSRGAAGTATTFTKRKAIYTAPKAFQGFNGIAFGPDGRLYVGVDVGLLNGNDHGPAKTPFVYDILSIKPNGKGLKVFASGMRQPWQMVFPKGSSSPLVSDLGQDKGAKNPPDFILQGQAGRQLRVPECNQTVASKCKGFAKPFKKFGPHTDIMGMTIIGKTLYMTSFLGRTARRGEILSMPLRAARSRSSTELRRRIPNVGLGVRVGTRCTSAS